MRSDPLTTERLVEGALRLVEAEGAEAVTMRRLAAELDTAPASLYRHIESREELLRLVGERIVAEITIDDDPAAPWQERTAAWANSARRALRRSRGRVALLVGPATPAPESFPLFQAGVHSYVAAGFPPDVASATARAVVFVVLSFVDVESQWPDALHVAPGSLLTDRRDVAEPDQGSDEMFDFLLGAVIANVERRLADEA